MKSLGLLRNIVTRSRTSRVIDPSSKPSSLLILQNAACRPAGIIATLQKDSFLGNSSSTTNWIHRQSFTSNVTPLQISPDNVNDEDDVERRLRFEEMDVHPKSLKALRRKGLHTMTEIQEKTFTAASSGTDVLGRARTGTGKTLAFLLPGLERVLRNPIRDQVNMLVLSPTRELAQQISEQSRMLLNSHHKSIVSQVIYGGAPKRDDIRRFEDIVPTILVATPGRLKDHLASTRINGIPFIDYMQELQVLVLDETDRLLDMGFRQDIEDIVSCLPRDRQTLLFSATIPHEVRSVIKYATKPDLITIDCMEDKDPATHTNAMTEQSHVILPPSRTLTGPVEILLDLVENPKNKVMAFFPMTSLVQLYSNLFSTQFGRRVLELHGKMEQRTRSRISQRFRNSKSGTLFTSDVSARGVDYPDVTHVVQMGAAETRETYIHRLGRTGRAGKKGKGILLLPEIEKHFLYDLDGLEIPVNETLQSKMNAPPSKKLMNELGPVAQDVRAGRKQDLAEAASDSYHAMVAYYFQRAQKRRSDDDELVETINSLVLDVGLRELPGISFQRAKKLRIDRVRGLNIEHGWNDKKDWASGESWVQKPSGRRDSDGGGFNNRSRSSSRDRGGRRDSFGGRGDFHSQKRRNSFSGGQSFGDRNSNDGPNRKSQSFGRKDSGNFGSDRGESFHARNDASRMQPKAEVSTQRSKKSFPSEPQWKKDAFGLDSPKEEKFGYANGVRRNKKGSFKRWDSSRN